MIADPGFHRTNIMYPPGMLAAWQDEKKSFTIFFSISTTSAAPVAPAGDGEQEADAGPPPAPHKVPLFTITAVRGDKKPQSRGTIKDTFGADAIELARSTESPDDALKELFAIQQLATTVDVANHNKNGGADDQETAKRLVALKGSPALVKVLQEVPLPAVRMPQLLFGLSDCLVLAKLEGDDAVEHCEQYWYVEVSCTYSFLFAIRSCAPKRGTSCNL